MRYLCGMAVDESRFRELVLLTGSSPDVDQLGITKLWKLLYFIDAEALREIGRTITESEYIKYKLGPVPSRGEKILGKLRREEAITTVPEKVGGFPLNKIVPTQAPDESKFSQEELGVIRRILKRHGKRTASALSELSHKEPSWRAAQKRDKISASLMAYGESEDPDGL